MNAKIGLTLIALLLIAIVPASAQEVVTGVKVSVDLINQDPDPVEPGGTVELRFRLENTGTQTLRDSEIEIQTAYPFTVIGDAVQTIPSVSPTTVSAEGVTVKYRLSVDPNAVTDDYLVDVRYRLNGAWIVVEDFAVSVKEQTTDLNIRSVDINPPVAEPGQAVNISVVLGNQLAQTVKDVKVSLDLSDSTLPFAPFGSTSEVFFPEIRGRSTEVAGFQLISAPKSEAGLYKVPINVQYENLNGAQFNKTLITGIRIGSQPELLLITEDSRIVSGNGMGTVRLKLVNKGLTDIRFAVLTIAPTSDVEVLSNREEYLGEIESDDFETTDVTLRVRATDEDAVDLPVTLSYRDATNKEHVESLTARVRLLTADEANQLGITQGGSPIFPLLVVVVIVGGIWWWMRRRKKNKKA